MSLPTDEAIPPSIVINPHSELGKELRKWEQFHTHLVPQGTQPGNPYVFRQYPRMLYKAQVFPLTNQPSVGEPAPNMAWCKDAVDYERRCLLVDQFNNSCHKIVPSEGDELIAKGQGWCETQEEALKHHETLQCEIGELAARAAFAVQSMSEKAQAELSAADASTEHHVVDVVGSKKGPRVIAPAEKN